MTETIPLTKIEDNPYQPRLAYKEQRKRDLIALERWAGSKPVVVSNRVIIEEA